MLCSIFLNANKIYEKDYFVETDKLDDSYDILFISDCHYGYTQNKSVLKDTIEYINSALDVDVVILGGDITDFRTSKDSMLEAFEMLGSIKSKYGVYFVYGNHDRQDDANVRKYSYEELEDCLEINDITVLNDDYIDINNMRMIGREDVVKFGDSRKSVGDMISPSMFNIVVDHQPIECDKNASYGVDLQLSGHTHAGQIFPISLCMWLNKMPIYGEYIYDNMKLIVSSGAGTGFAPIRTEEHCEYMLIHIN